MHSHWQTKVSYAQFDGMASLTSLRLSPSPMLLLLEAQGNFQFSFEGTCGVAGSIWRMKRLRLRDPKLDVTVGMNV